MKEGDLMGRSAAKSDTEWSTRSLNKVLAPKGESYFRWGSLGARSGEARVGNFGVHVQAKALDSVHFRKLRCVSQECSEELCPSSPWSLEFRSVGVADREAAECIEMIISRFWRVICEVPALLVELQRR
jgi:hypothetical protein